MIGTLDKVRLNGEPVVVVGGGIAGLLAAYRVTKAGHRVLLVEKKPRLGGLIATKKTDRFLSEAAANSLLGSADVIELLDELKIRWVKVRETSKARYILRGGLPRKMPLKFSEIFGILFRVFFSRAPADRNTVESETLQEWGVRFLGPIAVKYLLSPFVRGVYGCSPSDIQVSLAFKKLVVEPGKSLLSLAFKKREKKPKSQGMIVPVDGIGSLIDSLDKATRATGLCEVRLSSEMTAEQLLTFKNSILAVPAIELADLLASSDGSSAVALRAVQYAPLVSVTVSVPNSEWSPKEQIPSGVGVLIPECEVGPGVIGVLYSSASFKGRSADEEKYSTFTVMIGGTTNPAVLKLNDDEIRRLVVKDLRQLLAMSDRTGVSTDGWKFEIYRWDRAVPVYNAALKRAQDSLKKGYCSKPGRVVFTNHSSEVSIRGMIEASKGIV